MRKNVEISANNSVNICSWDLEFVIVAASAKGSLAENTRSREKRRKMN